jgi:hypothetical protein
MKKNSCCFYITILTFFFITKCMGQYDYQSCELSRSNVLYKIWAKDETIYRGDSIQVKFNLLNNRKTKIFVFREIFNPSSIWTYFDSTCNQLQTNLDFIYTGETDIIPELYAINPNQNVELELRIPLPYLYKDIPCLYNVNLTVFFGDIFKYLKSVNEKRWKIEDAEFYSHCEIISIGALMLTLSNKSKP